MNGFHETDVAFRKAHHDDHSGTTAIAALLLGTRLYVANAGDCRAVLGRRGKGIQLSTDHKPLHEEEKRRIEVSHNLAASASSACRAADASSPMLTFAWQCEDAVLRGRSCWLHAGDTAGSVNADSCTAADVIEDMMAPPMTFVPCRPQVVT